MNSWSSQGASIDRKSGWVANDKSLVTFIDVSYIRDEKMSSRGISENTKKKKNK